MWFTPTADFSAFPGPWVTLTSTRTTASHSSRAVCERSCRKTIFSASSVSFAWLVLVLINPLTSRFSIATVGCSHVRAWQYFVESIRRPQAFLSERCENTNNESFECLQSVPAYMGFAANRRLRGKFFLTTNGVSPFGRNFPIWFIQRQFVPVATSESLSICLLVPTRTALPVAK